MLFRQTTVTGALACLLVPLAAFADLVVEEGKLAVVSNAGISSHSREFSSSSPVAASNPPLPLVSLDTLKLSFTLLESTRGGPEPLLQVPQQVAVLATGKDTRRSWQSGSVKVRKGGKARWELDLARAPPSFLNLSPTGKVALELLVAGAGEEHKPLRLWLGSLDLAGDAILPYPYWGTKDSKPPASLEVEKYAIQPELEWTFKPLEKSVNPVISFIFTSIVLSPWVVLLGLWSHISSTHSSQGFSLSPSRLTQSLTLSLTAFFICILSQEALILAYWFGLKLYQYLPAAGLLGVPLLLSGRKALGEVKERREAVERKWGVGAAKGKKKAE